MAKFLFQFSESRFMKTVLLSRHFLKGYMNYGFCAALVYSIVAIIFLKRAKFEDSWLLNLGNVGFALVIALYGWRERFKISNGINKVITGILVTITGILICYVMLFLVINVIVTIPLLKDAPANNVSDRRNGLLWMVAINAGILNFACGSFISLMIAYSVQRFRKNT